MPGLLTPASWQKKRPLFNQNTIFLCFDMTVKEFLRCLNHIITVLDSRCLIRRMHGKLRQSDIHTVHGYLSHRNIAKCPAISERFAKNCTGTPAFSQIPLNTATLTASLVYFCPAWDLTTIPSFI